MATQGDVLRDYQARAANEVVAAWDAGASGVCLVGPTGCGKTAIASSVIRRREGNVLWVVHRVDLRRQNVQDLRRSYDGAFGEGHGYASVASLKPGATHVRAAPVTVASVQTLLDETGRRAIGERTFGTIVFEEAAHYRADDWQTVRERFGPEARLLGLTAFPQRSDGRSLRPMFGAIVVASRYAALVRDGHLVPCGVWRPEGALGRDLAMDPAKAWLAHSGGAKTFAFAARQDLARDLVDRLRQCGIAAGAVLSGDSETERRATLQAYRKPAGSAGELRVLVSVDALTEGIDEPPTACALLCRPFRFEGAYVQATGRALRPWPSKRYATVIDLTGCSAVHGLPTDERDYEIGEDAEGARSTGERTPSGERDEVPDPRVVHKPLFFLGDAPKAEPIEAQPAQPPIVWARNVKLPRVTRATPAAALFGCK